MGLKTFFSNLFGNAKVAEPGKDGITDIKGKSCQDCGTKGKIEKTDAGQSSVGRVVAFEDIVNFVEYVVKLLVDYPDEVVISTEEKENAKQINIKCRQSDRGKIIGKKGKTIIALRALAAGAAGRLQNRVMIEVLDDEDESKEEA